MRSLVFFAILSLAIPVIGGDVPHSLVLGTGTIIENVTMKVNGGMVWITFSDGHMEAYSTEDVDLEASGLIAEENNDDIKEPDRRSMMTKLADARSDGESSSTITITDADVEHVVPDVEEEKGTDKEDQGPLAVTGIFHSIVNGRVNVKGTVTNTTTRAISNITVAVVAIGFDGAVVANGNARLNRALGPKKGTEFSLMMVGATEFQEIKARARGTSSGERSNLNMTRPSHNPHARQAPRGKEH